MQSRINHHFRRVFTTRRYNKATTAAKEANANIHPARDTGINAETVASRAATLARLEGSTNDKPTGDLKTKFTSDDFLVG
jgi:hypothetical protein